MPTTRYDHISFVHNKFIYVIGGTKKSVERLDVSTTTIAVSGKNLFLTERLSIPKMIEQRHGFDGVIYKNKILSFFNQFCSKV